jgi:hypothetical protein
MKVTNRILGLAAVGLFGLSSSARAQDINFVGYTQGCFYGPFDATCAPSNSSTLTYLQYVASTFNVTSYEGEAGIGANAGTPNIDNLGSFKVTGDPASYNGSHFLLNVVFSLPTIISAPSTFQAAVRGSVIADAHGSVKIAFDPYSQVFDFRTTDASNNNYVGDFTLNIQPTIALTPGAAPAALTGDIVVNNVTATPEPGTTALFATGLVGLVPVFRLRRRKGSEV